MHEPLEVPADAASKAACADLNVSSPIGEWANVGRHTLCTMASGVDTAVGQMVDMLKAKGMWENTLLWLTTDNGGMTTGPKADHIGAWSASSNYPLRGGKGTLFEGGVRGVSFVSGGYVPESARGQTRTELMMHVDIPATMAKIAGVTWGDKTEVDGVDVWDAIVSGGASGRDEVPVNVDTCVGLTGGPPCARKKKYNALISSDGYKLIEANWVVPTCANSSWCTGAGLYDGWWSNDPYSHVMPNATTQGPMPSSDVPQGGIWLFDLSTDPNEKLNLATRQPATVQKMRARLAELADPKKGYRDPQFNIPNPRSFPALHNNTWSPFRKLGESLAPPLPSEVADATAAALAGAYWD